MFEVMFGAETPLALRFLLALLIFIVIAILVVFLVIGIAATQRGYVEKTLGPGESVRYRTKLHWIVYRQAAVFAVLLLGPAIWIAFQSSPKENFFAPLIIVGAAAFALVAFFLQAWMARLTTEIVVTNWRVVVKVGLVRRTMMEMNVGKIESLIIEQSVLERLLDYGTVVVKGTGAGIEPIANVAHPLRLRSAVAALCEPGGYSDANSGANQSTRHEVPFPSALPKPALRRWIVGVVVSAVVGVATISFFWKMSEQQPARVPPPPPQRIAAPLAATPAIPASPAQSRRVLQDAPPPAVNPSHRRNRPWSHAGARSQVLIAHKQRRRRLNLFARMQT